MRSTPALLPDGTFAPERLLAPQQALAAYLGAVRLGPLGSETVPLGDAWSRILAADAVAAGPHPAHDRSTMDGYAVRSADGITPRIVVGAIRMGAAPPHDLAPGEALEIPTGGVLPAGADAVMPIEDVERAGDTILPRAPVAPGDSVTRAGADMTPGTIALATGRRIGGPELGVLATLGIVDVPVFRRPVVAIVSTGDELIDASRTPGIGQIRDSNRWAIAGSLRALGAEPRHLPNAPDDPAALRAALDAALAFADAVVFTGGSSVGERDHTPDVIAAAGSPGVVVHGLRVKPGKPTVLGAIGRVPVLGLPGNPTSALMILEAIAAPIFHALAGERLRHDPGRRVVAGADFSGRAGWTWYVPAELRAHADGERAYPLALRSSHTSLLARAAGYVVLAEDRPRIEAGEILTILSLSGGMR